MRAKKANDHTTNRLSDEDQLYVWCLLLQYNLAGKVAPAHKKDLRRVEYALLVPEGFAAAAVNAVSDTPIAIRHLQAIIAQFRHLDPPYTSIPPNAERRRAYMRDLMRSKRAVSKNQEVATKHPSCRNQLTAPFDSVGKY